MLDQLPSEYGEHMVVLKLNKNFGSKDKAK